MAFVLKYQLAANWAYNIASARAPMQTNLIAINSKSICIFSYPLDARDNIARHFMSIGSTTSQSVLHIKHNAISFNCKIATKRLVLLYGASNASSWVSLNYGCISLCAFQRVWSVNEHSTFDVVSILHWNGLVTRLTVSNCLMISFMVSRHLEKPIGQAFVKIDRFLILCCYLWHHAIKSIWAVLVLLVSLCLYVCFPFTFANIMGKEVFRNGGLNTAISGLGFDLDILRASAPHTDSKYRL